MGRETPLRIFEPLAADSEDGAVRLEYTKALTLYRSGNFIAAAAIWERPALWTQTNRTVVTPEVSAPERRPP